MESGKNLDEFFWGGVHPNNYGYLVMWRQVAKGLDLSLPVSHVYDETAVQENVVTLEPNAIKSDTWLDAMGEDELPIFVEGVTVCAITQERFCLDITYPGTVVCYKYTDGYGKQIFKPFYMEKEYVRNFVPGSGWTSWVEKGK